MTSYAARPKRLFVYGTLCDKTLFRIVAGARLEQFSPRRGLALGLRTVHVRGESFPTLARGGGSAPGLLLEGLSLDAWQRISFYEDPDFRLTSVRVRASRAVRMAQAFLGTASLKPSNRPWVLHHWQRHEKRRALAAAERFMNYIGAPATIDLDEIWRQIEAEEI